MVNRGMGEDMTLRSSGYCVLLETMFYSGAKSSGVLPPKSFCAFTFEQRKGFLGG